VNPPDRKISALVLVSLMVLAVLCCSRNDCDVAGPCCDDLLYFNSFESNADTVGWHGNGGIAFSRDTAPRGGSRSLSVSGGCIFPHVTYTLEPVRERGSYTIRLWAKAILQNGSVLLRIADMPGNPPVSISVDQPEWASYTTDRQICCPAGRSLVIEMDSGGFSPGEMLVDLVEVIRVD
jgi:hypothetical protein